MAETDLYDTDILLWSEEQAKLLRQRSANELDWDNLAEEIESMGKSQRREVRSRLQVLLQHLLKWTYQPEHQSRSWRTTIISQRHNLEDVLTDSPSLRPYAATVLRAAYVRGREAAENETGVLRLPEECPWTIGQILDPKFWP
jgi:hypothetical protein